MSQYKIYFKVHSPCKIYWGPIYILYILYIYYTIYTRVKTFLMGAFFSVCTASRSFRNYKISPYQRYIWSFECRVLVSLPSLIFAFSYLYFLVYLLSFIVHSYVPPIFLVQLSDCLYVYYHIYLVPANWQAFIIDLNQLYKWNPKTHFPRLLL